MKMTRMAQDAANSSAGASTAASRGVRASPDRSSGMNVMAQKPENENDNIENAALRRQTAANETNEKNSPAAIMLKAAAAAAPNFPGP